MTRPHGRLVPANEHRMSGEVRVMRPPSPNAVLPAVLAAASERDFVSIGAIKRLRADYDSELLGAKSLDRLREIRANAEMRPRPTQVSAEMVELLDIIEHLDARISMNDVDGRLKQFHDHFCNQPSDLNFLIGVAETYIRFAKYR